MVLEFQLSQNTHDNNILIFSGIVYNKKQNNYLKLQ